jgi:alpha-1,3-glucosyltransferase
MRSWYFEATSQWTLDYPPFFALFEWILSVPAQWIDPNMLRISAEPYQSDATVLYQRLTVILSDLVLFYAIVRFVRARSSSSTSSTNGSGGNGNSGWNDSFSEPRRRWLLLFLCFANPGLLLLDHVHFQYNGFLFGIFLLSLVALVEQRPLWAAFWFSVTLHFKHIYLYVAPVFFIYLLCGFVLQRDTRTGRVTGFSLLRLVQLGSIVLGVSAVSLGPYLAWGQGAQLLARLFPFQRGLCHAYWAPNVWVVSRLRAI